MWSFRDGFPLTPLSGSLTLSLTAVAKQSSEADITNAHAHGLTRATAVTKQSSEADITNTHAHRLGNGVGLT